jgi:hypothetical protein
MTQPEAQSLKYKAQSTKREGSSGLRLRGPGPAALAGAVAGGLAASWDILPFVMGWRGSPASTENSA